MNNNCFQKLNIKLNDENKLYKDFLNMDYHQVEVPGKIYESKHTFLRAEVPFHYFEDEPIGEIMKKYKLIAKIFLIQANHFYNWHRDSFRQTAFNMLLQSDEDYFTIFSHTTEASTQLSINNFFYAPQTQLKYEKGYFYLLNSQKPHMVSNCSNMDRYVLTLANYENKTLDHFYGKPANYSMYNFMVEDLQSLNLI